MRIKLVPTLIQVTAHFPPLKMGFKIWLITQRKSGIYAIVNNATGDCYIGKSVNISSRLAQHYRSLIRGKDSRNMQAAWSKDSSGFAFFVVDECSKAHLDYVETEYIDQFGTYNIAGGSSNKHELSLRRKRVKNEKPHWQPIRQHVIQWLAQNVLDY